MSSSDKEWPSDGRTLGELMDGVVRAGSGDHVSVEAVLDEFGRRSFGPMILVPSALVASPLSGIPGFATVCAVIISLVSVQLLIGRDSPWLPRFIRRRRLERARLDKAVAPVRRVAGWIDGVLEPRLEFLTRGLFGRGIAGICLLLALAMPPTEVVPMANSIIGGVIAVFALALVSRDGFLAILALALAIAGGVAIWTLIQ